MLSYEEIERRLKEVNDLIPVHSMWDGFWVHQFDKDELTISCSFDRLYYREYDVFFKGVTFFNLPKSWLDSDIYDDELFRLTDNIEFQCIVDEEFEVGDKYIFALELHYKTLPEKNVI